MSIISFLDKAVVIVRRDALIALRYRAGFALGIAGAISELAAFYYMLCAIA